MQSTERTTSDVISETEFYDKYFGFIITKRQLEGKTANGNQKFLVSVGREGEVIAKHIAVKVYSHKTGKWYMSYAAKPTAKLDKTPREEQYQPKKSVKEAKFEEELDARAVASMLGSE